MAYSWLLFDADGTLYDFTRAQADALRALFAELGLPPRETTATFEMVNTRVWQELERGEIQIGALAVRRFALLFAALQSDLDPRSASARYVEHLSRGIHLVPGAAALVPALAHRYRLAIITNGLAAVQRPRFAASPIGSFFDPVVISDELGVAKPDPAIFDIAFTRMGHPSKDEVLLIGDSLTSDIRGGSDYGLDTCWFNPGAKAAPADLTITHQIAELTELPAILGDGSAPPS